MNADYRNGKTDLRCVSVTNELAWVQCNKMHEFIRASLVRARAELTIFEIIGYFWCDDALRKIH